MTPGTRSELARMLSVLGSLSLSVDKLRQDMMRILEGDLPDNPLTQQLRNVARDQLKKHYGVDHVDEMARKPFNFMSMYGADKETLAENLKGLTGETVRRKPRTWRKTTVKQLGGIRRKGHTRHRCPEPCGRGFIGRTNTVYCSTKCGQRNRAQADKTIGRKAPGKRGRS